jgi:UDP-glucose 4-epimerase
MFNTVGPRQSPDHGMVVPRLIGQAVTGQPVTVYGDGRQTRCFCHVGDVVDALVRLLDDERAVGQVFNVGSTEEVSVLDLASRIRTIAGTQAPIRFVPYEEAYEPGFEDMARPGARHRAARVIDGLGAVTQA